jgi:hypothetical protein
MKIAEVNNGVVVNVIKVDPENIPEWALGWPSASEVGIGWAYDPVTDTFTRPEPEPRPIAEVRAEAIADAIVWIDRLTAAILDKYPRAEQGAFPYKADAAEAYLAGTATPRQRAFIDMEVSVLQAADSTLTATDVCNRILAKADAYSAISQMVSGMRQNLETAIAAATDAASVQTALDEAQATVIKQAAAYGLTAPV